MTLNAPPPAIYDALAKCTRLRSVLLIETPEGGQTARLGLLERRQDVEVVGGSVGRRGVEVDKSHLDLGPVRPDLLKVRVVAPGSLQFVRPAAWTGDAAAMISVKAATVFGARPMPGS